MSVKRYSVFTNRLCNSMWLSLLVFAALIAGIGYLTPYKIPPELFVTSDDAGELAAAEHPLYRWVPRHRRQIAYYDIGRWLLWSILGNDDDGIFGEARPLRFRPEEPPSVTKALRWAIRNPLHNFCFYVIGSAERSNSEFTLLRLTPQSMEWLRLLQEGTTVFAGGRSLFIAWHGGKPFLSVSWDWGEGHVSLFYIGWRHRGNFGFKCVLWKALKGPGPTGHI